MGTSNDFDMDLLMPDARLSLRQGALALYNGGPFKARHRERLCHNATAILGIDIDHPFADIRERQRQAFWHDFESARPSILGGLLDAVAGALARHPKVTLPTLPRMADFASWAVAAEPNLGCAKEGIFLAAYEGNRAQAHVLALEASPIAGAVRTLAGREAWKGTATELLETLGGIASEALRRAKGWPSSPRLLSGALRRVVPSLREVGILVDFPDEKALGAARRQILIRTDPEFSVPTVPPVPVVPRNAQERSGNDAQTRVGTDGNDGNGEMPTSSDPLPF